MVVTLLDKIAIQPIAPTMLNILPATLPTLIVPMRPALQAASPVPLIALLLVAQILKPLVALLTSYPRVTLTNKIALMTEPVLLKMGFVF